MARKLTPEELEREIEAQRKALADTLEQVGDRMSRDRILGEAAALIGDYGRDIGRGAVRAARANPGMALAAGAGLAVLAFGAARLIGRDDRAEARRLPQIEGDTAALVETLKARLDALETQRSASERARSTHLRRRFQKARKPLVYALGAMAMGAAVNALRGSGTAGADMPVREAAARAGEDIAAAAGAAMDAGVPTGANGARTGGRH